MDRIMRCLRGGAGTYMRRYIWGGIYEVGEPATVRYHRPSHFPLRGGKRGRLTGLRQCTAISPHSRVRCCGRCISPCEDENLRDRSPRNRDMPCRGEDRDEG